MGIHNLLDTQTFRTRQAKFRMQSVHLSPGERLRASEDYRANKAKLEHILDNSRGYVQRR